MILFKRARRVNSNCYCTFAVNSDLFGKWHLETNFMISGRTLRSNFEIHDSENIARQSLSAKIKLLKAKGWQTDKQDNDALRNDFQNVKNKTLREYSSYCATTLEHGYRTHKFWFEDDILALVEALGLAHRAKRRLHPPEATNTSMLALDFGPSTDTHIRDVATHLFAGLMAQNLRGKDLALEIARQNLREQTIKKSDGKVVNFIPKWSRSRLDLNLDDFFHLHPNLKRIAYRYLMPYGIIKVRQLISLSKDQLHELIKYDDENLDKIQTALREEGLWITGSQIPNKLAL